MKKRGNNIAKQSQKEARAPTDPRDPGSRGGIPLIIPLPPGAKSPLALFVH